jgi:hypothetical protein
MIKLDKLYKNLTLTLTLSWNMMLELGSFGFGFDDLIFNEFAI